MAVELKRKQPEISDFFATNSKRFKSANKASTITITNSAIDASDEIRNTGKSTTKTTNAVVSTNLSQELSKVIFTKEKFQESLSTLLTDLLSLEIETMETSWFKHLQNEFRKPYFVKLKQFVTKEQRGHDVFPPSNDIYSWTKLTPFDQVKVVIIGQDPYHNHNQAHGLAFSVKPPTSAPPSLKNIYKELKQNYPDFEIDNKVGNLTPWALQGVLLLNTALTVRAHSANSHSKQGWEVFTRKVVEILIKDREKDGKSLVFLLWGNNAIKLVDSLLNVSSLSHMPNLKVLKSVHPSPLSASRGFFGNNHFKQINDWLYSERHEKMIDWSVVPGSHLTEVVQSNQQLTDIDK